MAPGLASAVAAQEVAVDKASLALALSIDIDAAPERSRRLAGVANHGAANPHAVTFLLLLAAVLAAALGAVSHQRR